MTDLETHNTDRCSTLGLSKKKGYKHGNINETISSVLGKNEYFGTLTKTGIALVKILNFIDKNHCAKSIDWDV